jgi:hypothetical protein
MAGSVSSSEIGPVRHADVLFGELLDVGISKEQQRLPAAPCRSSRYPVVHRDDRLSCRDESWFPEASVIRRLNGNGQKPNCHCVCIIHRARGWSVGPEFRNRAFVITRGNLTRGNLNAIRLSKSIKCTFTRLRIVNWVSRSFITLVTIC